MNKFKKFCPNVWVAECDTEYKRGEVIELETQYGKIVEANVFNLVAKTATKFYYSIIRIEDMSYAERKALRYNKSSERHTAESDRYYQASQEGREFLSLGEPIKVGHHSENRHRALIDRNHNRMGKSIEHSEKAKAAAEKAVYWESKAEEITLAMPESIKYFTYKLEKATDYHSGLKSGKYPKEHSYSLSYASKAVKELKKKVEIANLLWGN